MCTCVPTLIWTLHHQYHTLIPLRMHHPVGSSHICCGHLKGLCCNNRAAFSHHFEDPFPLCCCCITFPRSTRDLPLQPVLRSLDTSAFLSLWKRNTQRCVVVCVVANGHVVGFVSRTRWWLGYYSKFTRYAYSLCVWNGTPAIHSTGICYSYGAE